MSAGAPGSGVPDNSAKLLESLQADLKVLASETKKKYPQIKEVCFSSLFIFFSLHISRLDKQLLLHS